MVRVSRSAAACGAVPACAVRHRVGMRGAVASE
jgi:hypothetical protein